MISHNLTPNTPEWLAYRDGMNNASEACSMMNIAPSNYMTRDELLMYKATGVRPEVTPYQQKIFDNGHRFEALARPLAEEIIGDDLFQKVLSEGRLSASFDGITMCSVASWEHKTLNQAIIAAIDAGEELPKYLRVQMEQQTHISGSEKCLFMASAWDEHGNLIDKRECWYYPDYALRAEIIAGWEQFDKDVEELKRKIASGEFIAPSNAVVGVSPETLPALRIEVTGMVTASNLAEFKQHALNVIGSINTELNTDEDFANAKSAVKWCGDVEKRLEAAKQHALSQTESIEALFRAIDDIAAETRAKRLNLGNLVKSRDTALKIEIKQKGESDLRDYIASIEKTFNGKARLPVIVADFSVAIKGMSNFANMRSAVGAELARARAEADRLAALIHANLLIMSANTGEFKSLFPDSSVIVLKQTDDLVALIKSRISDYKAAEEKRIESERKRIREEEQAKIEAEARVERERIKADENAKVSASSEPERSPKDEVEKVPNYPSSKPVTVVHGKERPSANLIVDALMQHFGEDKATVTGWLVEYFGVSRNNNEN